MNVFLLLYELWICSSAVHLWGVEACLHVCGSQRLSSQLAPFQMEESHLSPLSSSLLSSRNVRSLHQAFVSGCCLHYLVAAPPLSPPAVCLPAACRLPSPAPMARPPSLTLPPPLLLNSSRSLTLCLPPLFPACLPTEDCDCEGYFNGQYIGESVHIFLHLLLPICSLPAAAWLCAGSPGAFGLGVKMTACRVDLFGARG